MDIGDEATGKAVGLLGDTLKSVLRRAPGPVRAAGMLKRAAQASVRGARRLASAVTARDAADAARTAAAGSLGAAGEQAAPSQLLLQEFRFLSPDDTPERLGQIGESMRSALAEQIDAEACAFEMDVPSRRAFLVLDPRNGTLNPQVLQAAAGALEGVAFEQVAPDGLPAVEEIDFDLDALRTSLAAEISAEDAGHGIPEVAEAAVDAVAEAYRESGAEVDAFRRDGVATLRVEYPAGMRPVSVDDAIGRAFGRDGERGRAASAAMAKSMPARRDPIADTRARFERARSMGQEISPGVASRPGSRPRAVPVPSGRGRSSR